ncbi:MAG: DUF2252 family protein [Alphaproteobacteria bacterium]
MAADPFQFLRATYWRWAETIFKICPDLKRAPHVLAVGDLHVENYGTWRDAEGRLVWGRERLRRGGADALRARPRAALGERDAGAGARGDAARDLRQRAQGLCRGPGESQALCARPPQRVAARYRGGERRRAQKLLEEIRSEAAQQAGQEIEGQTGGQDAPALRQSAQCGAARQECDVRILLAYGRHRQPRASALLRRRALAQ